MYQYFEGKVVISVNDWLACGLTKNQLWKDSSNGLLSIADRRIGGETLIYVESIKRADRLRVIEAMYGASKKASNCDIYEIRTNTEAREFYTTFRKPDGTSLTTQQVEDYTKLASAFTVLRSGRITEMTHRKNKFKSGEWYSNMLRWFNLKCEDQYSYLYGLKSYTNVRVFERKFKDYCSRGYVCFIHGLVGERGNAKHITEEMENLWLSLWRTQDKPFIERVHELYNEFLSGRIDMYDKTTGELLDHKSKKYKPVSVASIWNCLKDHLNFASVYSDRNGNFDYANSKRPKHHRQMGRYSLSKVSMDDAAMSRKSVDGWIFKYLAVDVLSGYWFRPAYKIGNADAALVMESFRNMFCELMTLGLPIPGELEVEHHLMQDITWLNDLFPFVRFCKSPTEKRAEHNIKALKYGAAKKLGQTRGRWYGKSEAYKGIRNKVKGDFIDPTFSPQAIIADDLKAIEMHNSSPHPDKKRFPGMTRKEVFLANINPELRPIGKSFLYQFIGNKTDTSIRNNDFCVVAYNEFEIQDFQMLKRLKPNNATVTAYWLPEDDGEIKNVYLYQDGTYIGEAVNRKEFAYNEFAFERTEADKDKMLHQQKRLAKFDKVVKTLKEPLVKVGYVDAEQTKETDELEVRIVQNIVNRLDQIEQENDYSDYENMDYRQMAIAAS